MIVRVPARYTRSVMTPLDCPQPGPSWTGRAFVVQLSPDAAPASGVFRGRVQHLRSEDALHFESLDELARFISLHAGEAAAARA
jgi:hypothetical protein